MKLSLKYNEAGLNTLNPLPGDQVTGKTLFGSLLGADTGIGRLQGPNSSLVALIPTDSLRLIYSIVWRMLPLLWDLPSYLTPHEQDTAETPSTYYITRGNSGPRNKDQDSPGCQSAVTPLHGNSGPSPPARVCAHGHGGKKNPKPPQRPSHRRDTGQERGLSREGAPAEPPPSIPRPRGGPLRGCPV